MAGTYGHEAEHRALSRAIFAGGWARHVGRAGTPPAATGYSCRAQAARFGGVALPHPATLLLERLRGRAGAA